MLLSRFWIIFLSVATVAALAAAMLSHSIINARSDSTLDLALRRDREVLNALLKLEARERLDRIAFISIDDKVGKVLRAARGVTDRDKLKDLSAPLKETLRSHVNRIVEAARSQGKSPEAAKTLKPDLVFALDADGRIVAQLGPLEANPPGSGIGTYPLVKRALQGYLRDDVWVYDRRVYRMAARPVVTGDYVGAIVHGYRLNDAFARELGEALSGATVTFFYGNSVLGSYTPPEVEGAPQGAEIASALSEVSKDSAFLAGERTEPIELQKQTRAAFSLIVGSAASAGVGYAVARPRKIVESPMTLFDEASDDDVRALPWAMLAGAALVLALLGLLFVYLERDRHLKALMARAGEVGKGDRDRLIITEWRGAYRKLADTINHAIEKSIERAGQMAPARKKANLDEILGDTPEASGTPFFGFAADDAAPATPPAAKPEPPAPAPPPAAPGGTSPGHPAPGHPGAAPTAATAPRVPPPNAAARPAQMPQPARAQAAPAAPPPAQASQQAAPAAPVASNGTHSEEDAHWRNVYAEYVQTRQQCGEPIEHLTFEKFGVTLKKTRDQIIEKHGAKTVRFSVQIKQGKAALKAQPVKK